MDVNNIIFSQCSFCVSNVFVDLFYVMDSFNNVVSVCFVFCVDYGSIFGNMVESFVQVFVVVDERNIERSFFNMVFVIGWGENFVFIDIVDVQCFEDLVFDKVFDFCFGYNRDCNCILNFFDDSWVRYVCDIFVFVDIGGDMFKSYDSVCVGFFGDVGLGCICDIYDDVVFEYLGEVRFEGEGGSSCDGGLGGCVSVVIGRLVGVEVVGGVVCYCEKR